MKQGIVIKSTGSRYAVIDDENNIYQCHIKGKFRIKGIKTTNPLAVGDHVEFSEIEGHGHNIINKILPRKNYIIRRSSKLSKLYHIIAANIDQAILVITLKQPATTTQFIDRFLITAEAYSIPPLLVFNKIDIYSPAIIEKMEELEAIYTHIGYTCIRTSCKTGENIENFANIIKNKVSLISGNSGVGKSTLINEVDPALNLKTNAISDYHQLGKHTTTFAEMHPLNIGGYIIDSPGIKSFGIIDFDKDELYHYFPEIFKHSKNCKYHNCVHLNEPNCEVKLACEKGKISESRYFNYLSILIDEEEKHR